MAILITCVSIALTYFSPSDLFPSLTPYHLQLLMMLFGLAVSGATLAHRPVRNLQSPQHLLILGLWTAVVLSQVTKLKIRWGWDGFYLFGTVVAVYFLLQINVFSLRRVKAVGALLIGCGVLMGFQAIVAYYTGYLGEQLLLFPPSQGPVFGTNRVCGYGILHDPNDFAQFLLVCVALLGLFWKRGQALRSLFLVVPPAAILMYACYLTFSRGALLGIGALMFSAIYRRHRRLVSFVGVIVALPLLQLLRFTGNREIAVDNTTAGRLIAWGAGVSATLRHPLFGVGFSRFTDINDLTAHNSFVLCFTELGLFGFFFWLALIFISLMSLQAVTNIEVKTEADQDYLGAVYALRAAFFAFLTTGWFLSRTYTETLYILLALAASLVQLRVQAVPAHKLRLDWWGPRTIALEFISIVAVFLMVKVRLIV